ncbi:hypothetical protein C1646_739046 [Rhizophagus diaphanus]|nr:hypothetical protein C1646_739046 [Rhizophagus diaphanus] [Rhizophagus sp. MUCL 43196]
MSNYSSLFRVLSPSRVQTKFEEKSLSARYTDIMIFCLVQGDAIKNSFPIDTRNYVTFGHLRTAIKDVKQNAFIGIDADRLTLWKVNIIQTKENQEVIVKDHKGVELHSFESVGSYFQETPTSTNIRIIVELPLLTTTRKRRWDLDNGNEDQDQKKGKLTVPETILTRAQKIMEDIKKLPEDRNVYSNPKNSLLLPFPFLGERKPVERFSIDDDKFLYMGRKVFDKVLNTINELKSGNGYMDFFIYGTMGYGKSYILATIVCFLLKTRKRVVYLPDCRELARKPEYYIKSALFLTYSDDSVKMSEIQSCVTLDDIIEFCNPSEQKEPLYFIVDQINALDSHDDTGIDESLKKKIKSSLNEMAINNYYIKSSSANNISALHLSIKQANEKKIELYGGFDEDEMAQWWQKYDTYLSIDYQQKEEIEYITGRNPLFLSFLLSSKGSFEDARNHLNKLLIENMQKLMVIFSNNVSESKWDLHIKLMSSFLTNSRPPTGYGDDDYDHRFFYIKENCCYCTSGFIRNCMADYLYEKGKMEVFSDSSWIRCIKEFKRNPSVKGFMVEKACIASIYKNGLMADTKNFKPDEYKFFACIDEINFTLSEGLCTIHLPRYWNQKSIDLLLTFYKTYKNVSKLYIAPIQITLDRDSHSNSEASFFSDIWPVLKLKVPSTLEMEIIFIWITHENDVDYFVEEKWKKLRGRNIEVNPKYTRIVKSFKNVNIDLENSLSC